MQAGHIIIAGIGACIIFDLWQRIFQRITGIPPSNWAMVGRWLLRLLSGGGLFQRDLAAQAPLPNELRAGWLLHYVVAIGYAAVYAGMMQRGWLRADAVDGLIFGVASVAVPWFFFMPALGAGVMARHTPNPPVACAVALMMHALFGLSLGLGFALLSG